MIINTRNNYLYTMVEAQRQMLAPSRMAAQFYQDIFSTYFSQTKAGRTIGASYELFERLTRHYEKPEFNIFETQVNGQKVNVQQKTVMNKTYCNLLRFKKSGKHNQPKILVVAPLSGHYSTLLRGTVEGLLPHYDVYITEWLNARDVPVSEGNFYFDDFVTYSIDFIKALGEGANVLAVCQPAVPIFVAVALMSAQKDPLAPKSLIMMGGPIDTRKNPTEVNDYAAEREIQWFEQNVITQVPFNYAGAGRYVYPGFMQLFGFMAMNMQNHIQAHTDLFNHLVEGDGDSAAAHKKFYNEYLAVMDMPAEFYLETVNIVFKKHSLPLGKLYCNGQIVDAKAIENTAIMCIEGERDDISGLGQTKAALNLCKNLDSSKKEYLMQKDVGHYGIFNGSRYRKHIVPAICKFTAKHQGKK